MKDCFRLLNDMREGQTTLEYDLNHREALMAMQTQLPLSDDKIIPTELYSTNKVVEERNKCKLEKLLGDHQLFEAIDSVVLHDVYKSKLLNKYELTSFSCMPYLWACVESVNRPCRCLRLAISW